MSMGKDPPTKGKKKRPQQKPILSSQRTTKRATQTITALLQPNISEKLCPHPCPCQKRLSGEPRLWISILAGLGNSAFLWLLPSPHWYSVKGQVGNQDFHACQRSCAHPPPMWNQWRPQGEPGLPPLPSRNKAPSTFLLVWCQRRMSRIRTLTTVQ